MAVWRRRAVGGAGTGGAGGPGPCRRGERRRHPARAPGGRPARPTGERHANQGGCSVRGCREAGARMPVVNRTPWLRTGLDLPGGSRVRRRIKRASSRLQGQPVRRGPGPHDQPRHLGSGTERRTGDAEAAVRSSSPGNRDGLGVRGCRVGSATCGDPAAGPTGNPGCPETASFRDGRSAARARMARGAEPTDSTRRAAEAVSTPTHGLIKRTLRAHKSGERACGNTSRARLTGEAPHF